MDRRSAVTPPSAHVSVKGENEPSGDTDTIRSQLHDNKESLEGTSKSIPVLKEKKNSHRREDLGNRKDID